MTTKDHAQAAAQAGTMPPGIAERLIAIGRVIEAPKTNAIYAPLHAAEPFAGVTIARDIRYGPDARNLLDVFTPDTSGALRLVLLFVHGGGFVRGDKHVAGSPFFDNVAVWAVRHGMIGVTMSYRLAPQAKWPSGPQDVALAINRLRAHIAAHGGDAARLYVMGSSAGANHVASYVAFPEFHPADGAGIAGAIFLSGSPFDPTVFDMTPYTDYFGTDAAAYAALSPTPGLLKTKVPLMLAWAGLDPPPIERQSIDLDAALRKAGRAPAKAVLKTHSHISLNNAIGTADTELTDQLLAFIEGRQ
ncbi:MAG: alpha/beta hydrolase [Hyphomicrobiales bacterium]|nr:alpha/beta hydrolase [Hyphomicrobiales bacterium]